MVISRLVLIFALPLDFHGRLRVVRSMFLPASLLKLRSSVRKVVWSRRQPMASVGAVLSLLDGPTGCDPAFCVVWLRFRLLHRYLALWPAEVGRVYRLFLDMVGEGCPGHGPIHLLSARAAEIGFRWDPLASAWSRPGLPLLGNLAGFVQHLKAAILDAWRNKVAADLCVRVFVVGLCLMSMAPCSSLILHIVVREIRLCFAASWFEVFGMVFFLDGFEARLFHVGFVPCRFCGAPDGDGHLFWECTFPPLVEIRENPKFHDLKRMDKGHWPRCLLWYGWLPKLSGVNGASPWAASASDRAGYLVESALGSYSSGLLVGWSPPDGFDAVEAASLLPDSPNVWTDGSLVLDRVTGVSSSGAGFFCSSTCFLLGSSALGPC